MMNKKLNTAILVTFLTVLSSLAGAGKPTYAETLKTMSNTGLIYELGRAAKNTTDACGVKVAKYVWDSAGKNKSWDSISPQIQKIQQSKECQSSAETLKVVSDEISNRNSAFLKYWAEKLFPKDQTPESYPAQAPVQVVVPEQHIYRADKVESYDWDGKEACSIDIIEKGLHESMGRTLYHQSDAGVGYFDKTQLISNEPIQIERLGQKTFYGRKFQEFYVTFKTQRGESFKVVTIDNSSGNIIGNVLLLGPKDVERSEHGLDLEYCTANYLSRISQWDDTKLSNVSDEQKQRYFTVGDKRYSMAVRSISSGLPYGGKDWDNFSDSAASVSVGNLGKIIDSIQNRH